jgi:hypothetical protein
MVLYIERWLKTPVQEEDGELVQPGDSGLAPILRAVLPLGAIPADASTGSFTNPMGLSKIQKAARTSAQGDALGRAYFETRSEVVGALADGSTAWLHGGSRMS